MRMLIYVILRGLCFINEWNAIINLQNNMVKNIQNLTNYIYIYIYIYIIRLNSRSTSEGPCRSFGTGCNRTCMFNGCKWICNMLCWCIMECKPIKE
jgi:hypothetical protein